MPVGGLVGVPVGVGVGSRAAHHAPNADASRTDRQRPQRDLQRPHVTDSGVLAGVHTPPTTTPLLLMPCGWRPHTTLPPLDSKSTMRRQGGGAGDMRANGGGGWGLGRAGRTTGALHRKEKREGTPDGRAPIYWGFAKSLSFL